MFSWFSRGKPSRETSPGGSVILRYGDSAPPETRSSFRDDSTEKFAVAREQVYTRFFGEATTVFHEVLPLNPHIDVFTYPPGHGRREFYTLVTGGMSDLAMKVPADAKGAPRRVELIFYCSEPKDEYLHTIRWLARFPHDEKTWIGSAHTIPNGNPPAPFWGSPALNTILLMPTIVRPDGKLSDELTLAGEPVHFLWVVPLTTPECNLKLEKGFDAIIGLFQQHRHPHVFDPNRKSYV